MRRVSQSIVENSTIEFTFDKKNEKSLLMKVSTLKIEKKLFGTQYLSSNFTSDYCEETFLGIIDTAYNVENFFESEYYLPYQVEFESALKNPRAPVQKYNSDNEDTKIQNLYTNFDNVDINNDMNGMGILSSMGQPPAAFIRQIILEIKNVVIILL
ncbi:hypothetical protein BB558_000784 [Smittium angustum]|uniref:Uncharacterized protein n=1 Tax=Smittium angustum TaxID=133377 RepID=A0A2U1JDL7_SMIAN|nr:hypothetical protein BB558_000784 [Smittium angustum]